MAHAKTWSRPLPQPLVTPKVMTLRTLDDVRQLMRHLPENRRARPTCQQVARDLAEAAAGGDVEGAAIALRLVLMLEGVECRPQRAARAPKGALPPQRVMRDDRPIDRCRDAS